MHPAYFDTCDHDRHETFGNGETTSTTRKSKAYMYHTHINNLPPLHLTTLISAMYPLGPLECKGNAAQVETQ